MRTPVKMLDLEDGLVDVSSTPYNLAATAGGALIDTSGGAITINLPALASVRNGKTYLFRLVAGASGVTLDPNGAEEIDGGSTNTEIQAGFPGLIIVARTTGGNAGWWSVAEFTN